MTTIIYYTLFVKQYADCEGKSVCWSAVKNFSTELKAKEYLKIFEKKEKERTDCCWWIKYAHNYKSKNFLFKIEKQELTIY